MATLTVGPTSTFPTIAAAMAAAGAGDTILLEAGYSNETATVTQTGMTVTGGAASTGISLSLGAGVATFTLGGTAPINVLDALDGDNIVGNGGNNTVTVTGGADAVVGGLGTDRLVVDYSLATGAVTGDSTTNFTDAVQRRARSRSRRVRTSRNPPTAEPTTSMTSTSPEPTAAAPARPGRSRSRSPMSTATSSRGPRARTSSRGM